MQCRDSTVGPMVPTCGPADKPAGRGHGEARRADTATAGGREAPVLRLMQMRRPEGPTQHCGESMVSPLRGLLHSLLAVNRWLTPPAGVVPGLWPWQKAGEYGRQTGRGPGLWPRRPPDSRDAFGRPGRDRSRPQGLAGCDSARRGIFDRRSLSALFRACR